MKTLLINFLQVLKPSGRDGTTQMNRPHVSQFLKPGRLGRIVSIFMILSIICSLLQAPALEAYADEVSADELFTRLGFDMSTPDDKDTRAARSPYGSKSAQLFTVNEYLHF